MVKYTNSVLAAANLLALAQALPAQPVCSLVVQVVTGKAVWVPEADPAWSNWEDPSKAKTTSTSSWSAWEDPSKAKTTSTSSWSDWEDPSKAKTTTTSSWSTWEDPSKAKTTTTSSWSTWEDPSKATTTSTSSADWNPWTSSASSTKTTTTSKVGGGFYSHSTESPYPTTYTTTDEHHHTTPSPTSTPSTTFTPSTTSTPSTTATPAPTACPYYDGSSSSKLEHVQGHGSCNSEYTVYCAARVTAFSSAVGFWEASNATVSSLADCLKICDDNSDCTAAIWTNYAGAAAQDLYQCYQTSNLPQPALFGGDVHNYAQIAYKGTSAGTCKSTYNTPQ